MKFSLPNFVFLLLIALSTGYLTFLTTKGGLTDNRHAIFLKKFTKRGRSVIYVLILMFIILVCQELNNQRSKDNKDLELKTEQKLRDLLITIGINSGVDSSTSRLFKKLSKAFADQNLKIDTLQNTIVTIRDSVNTSVTNYYSQSDPVIMIDSVGVIEKQKIDDNYIFGLRFLSIDAGSTNHEIYTTIFIEYKGGQWGLSKGNFFPKNLKIPKNGNWGTGFTINSVNEISKLYFHITGSYTTLDGTKSYKIDDVYEYDSSEKRTSTLNNSERNRIIKLIESKIDGMK